MATKTPPVDTTWGGMGDTEEWSPHILHLSALQLHDEAGRMSMEW